MTIEFRWLKRGEYIPPGWIKCHNRATCIHHHYGAILIYREVAA